MFEVKAQSRACAGCTRCCEGWLTGEALGHRFSPGRPCGWLCKSGCVIYENRPWNPCQTFVCEWKRQISIPLSMKPTESGVILVSRVQDGHDYIRVIACGSDIAPQVQEWARIHSEKHSVNIVIPGPSGIKIYSNSMEFRRTMSKIYDLDDSQVDP